METTMQRPGWRRRFRQCTHGFFIFQDIPNCCICHSQIPNVNAVSLFNYSGLSDFTVSKLLLASSLVFVFVDTDDAEAGR